MLHTNSTRMALIGSSIDMSYLPFKTGSAVLITGTITVVDAKIKSTSTVLITNEGVGGTIGVESVSLSDGVGFTINSLNALDTSTMKYLIIY